MSGPVTSIPPNALKAALRENRRQIGLWSSLCSNVVAEVLAYAGYDWIVVDTEHAPSDTVDVLSQLQGLATGSAEPVVRVAWNDAVLMKRLLDIGARSLLVPFVQSAEEAKAAVAATRYPPHGIRGVSVSHRANRFGRVPNYLHTAQEQICVLVQMETRTALAALEDIAAVDGIDGVFIGPSDLAADFGHLGNAAHPEVQAAIADACARAKAVGKPIGILAPVEADARRYFEMGFTYVAIGSDVGILSAGSTNLVARMREAIGEPKIRVAV
ncbi:alpha-dehydro-beta-deoxy-D-glucarate aldolase [Rhodovastum atsumiense]|uniref:4-hydroxy-2-oxo-heptane-1,7-dioate aldolase n=1 Tax=Rhodovastum atsumiense TaxID=504468 RepID=A0A5M6IYW2_9PROT|nr:aldolase/citrate lyase family protein [Rhodovastum atsumiense]KAA5612558.1 4-hydroxy-2-oxo-heptane-1,7-dioate aldolase [Rhodovastum atsumiense]CAH2601357.1 alpha-dehydro-beta-deoxy-D-glucarate aldolase [Rhodovastum atsumiense]